MPQSLAKIYIHAVFSTKNREPSIDDAWRDELFHVLGGLTNQLGCRSMVVGGVADHIHLPFQLSRTMTIADAVGKVKSGSSAWVNQTYAPASHFHWQVGYAAFSVSQSQVDVVREYIHRQAEHHEKQSFQDELRTWFRTYEMSWDERYVWD